MKEIMAIIRMNKMNQTKTALADAGVSSLTASMVLGRGKAKMDYQIIRGALEGYEEAIVQLGCGPKLIPKRLISIVVQDSQVSSVIDTIIKTNQTGLPGDGKIFVLPITDSLRVRTGETGDAALNEEYR